MRSITNTFWLSPRICCNRLIWLALCSIISVSAIAASVTTEPTVIPEERVEKTDSSKTTDILGNMGNGAKTAFRFALAETLVYQVSRYAAMNPEGYRAGSAFLCFQSLLLSAETNPHHGEELWAALAFATLGLARAAIPKGTPDNKVVSETFISINVLGGLLMAFDHREQADDGNDGNVGNNKWAFNYAPKSGGGQLILSRSF